MCLKLILQQKKKRASYLDVRNHVANFKIKKNGASDLLKDRKQQKSYKKGF